MEYEFDFMMDFDHLELYFEVHLAGINGENFIYSVYFADGLTDEKFNEIEKKIAEFYRIENGTYLGYTEVLKADDKVKVYLDIGNVTDPDDQNTAIDNVLKVLNDVPGIKSVIINEE